MSLWRLAIIKTGLCFPYCQLSLFMWLNLNLWVDLFLLLQKRWSFYFKTLSKCNKRKFIQERINTAIYTLLRNFILFKEMKISTVVVCCFITNRVWLFAIMDFVGFPLFSCGFSRQESGWVAISFSRRIFLIHRSFSSPALAVDSLPLSCQEALMIWLIILQ